MKFSSKGAEQNFEMKATAAPMVRSLVRVKCKAYSSFTNFAEWFSAISCDY